MWLNFWEGHLLRKVRYGFKWKWKSKYQDSKSKNLSKKCLWLSLALACRISLPHRSKNLSRGLDQQVIDTLYGTGFCIPTILCGNRSSLELWDAPNFFYNSGEIEVPNGKYGTPWPPVIGSLNLFYLKIKRHFHKLETWVYRKGHIRCRKIFRKFRRIWTWTNETVIMTFFQKLLECYHFQMITKCVLILTVSSYLPSLLSILFLLLISLLIKTFSPLWFI
jgi:hypothetical protein